MYACLCVCACFGALRLQHATLTHKVWICDGANGRRNEELIDWTTGKQFIVLDISIDWTTVTQQLWESESCAGAAVARWKGGPSDLYLLRNCVCCRVTCCLLPVLLLFRSFSSRQLQISSAATGIIPLMLLYIYFLNLSITKIPLSTKLTTHQN